MKVNVKFSMRVEIVEVSWKYTYWIILTPINLVKEKEFQNYIKYPNSSLQMNISNVFDFFFSLILLSSSIVRSN